MLVPFLRPMAESCIFVTPSIAFCNEKEAIPCISANINTAAPCSTRRFAVGQNAFVAADVGQLPIVDKGRLFQKRHSASK
jgi:hypothetical protein